MKNSNATRKVIGSLIVGALAGATLGVLFAPKKGTKTRKNIANESEKISDDLKKKMKNEAKEFRKNLDKKAKSLKNKATEFESLIEGKLESVGTALKAKTNSLLHTNLDQELKQK